jgi:hypothetical protein
MEVSRTEALSGTRKRAVILKTMLQLDVMLYVSRRQATTSASKAEPDTPPLSDLKPSRGVAVARRAEHTLKESGPVPLRVIR